MSTSENRPRLTVATVVKDDLEGFLRTTGSVAVQNRASVEWIVIDSSQDGQTVAGVARNHGARHQWVDPRGVYPAMNIALASAHGSYIHFLNAGDVYSDAGVVARLVEVLDTYSPLWLYGQVRFISPSGGVNQPHPFDYAHERETCFSRGRFPPHQGTVVSTEALRSLGGFDESYRIVADYAVMLGLSQLGDPIELDWTVADFHEGGLSTVAWRDSLREFHRARLTVMNPRGVARWRERYEYVAQWARMSAARQASKLQGGRGSS